MKRPGKGTCVCVANELEVVQKLNLEDNLPPQLLEHQFRTESGACKSVLTPRQGNIRVHRCNLLVPANTSLAVPIPTLGEFLSTKLFGN